MRPTQRLPLLWIGLALALGLLAAASVGIVWATLDADQRATLAALLAPKAMLVVALWLAAFGLVAWGATRAFRHFVEAPARLHEQAQVLLADTLPHALSEQQGSAAQRGLAATLNALVRQRTLLRQDVSQQIADASRRVEQERAMLSALMAELSQSVLVCNLGGRILLYNSRARALFTAWSATPVTAEGAELIGLGRSVYKVFDRALVAHALERIEQLTQAGEASPSAQFVTAGPAGQLLRVQMAPVQLAATPPTALSGFVLMLDDISVEVEQEAVRDRLLLALTEGSRASLGSLQAAVEMLALPDMDVGLRSRLQLVVRDEVAAMTARLQTLAADQLAGMKARWPLEDMLGADLLSAARRRIEGLGSVTVGFGEVDVTLWLKVDSYSLLQALVCLAGRLIDEHGVRSLQLRLQPAGRRAHLDLVWFGQSISTETVMGWQMDAMLNRSGSGVAATPLTVRDVVERHGGEFWFERERVRHESFMRFLLPCAEAPVAVPVPMIPPPAQPDDGRPEFYDFDLFQTSSQARALDDRWLSDLTYTVFDTETTGLNPSDGDEIIQIGATRIVNGKLLRRECLDQLVDPQRPLPAASTAIHGIEPRMLVDRPTILQVLPVFHAFAFDTVLVAHNAAFDMRFLQLKEAASGLRFDQPVLDTLLLSAWVQPNQASHRLEAIAERLGVALRGRHTALGDALVTAEVFLKLIPLLQARGVNSLGEARAAALQTFQARVNY